MKSHPFTPNFAELPRTLPVFPLSGCVLLPLGQLQLNIFEPRYLNLVFDALGAGRLIGIAQPDPNQANDTLYKTGCVGRLSAYSETPDGRLLINLTGVCRFEIEDEIATTRGYRRFLVNWDRYAEDMREHEKKVDTAPLLDALTVFFEHTGLKADMKSLQRLGSAALVNVLATNLPFEPVDKQTLVEALNLADRADILMTLARMATVEAGHPPPTRH